MRICTSYRQPRSIIEKVNEIRYPIGLFDVVLERLETDYIKTYIIEIFDLEKNTDLSLEQIHNLAVEHINLFFDFHRFDDFKTVAGLYNERKYMYHFPVNTYMDIQYLLQFQGLAAITLEEPLTFDIINVHKTIKEDEERDIQIRIYPTIGRPSRYQDYEGDNGINHFWVLPQHISLYEDYVDVIDLVDQNQTREHALCNIYTSKLPYLLNIQPLFKYVNTPMIGAFVDDDWAQKRLQCQQTCLHKGIHCTLCLRQDAFYNFALTHPDRIEQLIHQPLDLVKAPTNPELIATT